MKKSNAVLPKDSSPMARVKKITKGQRVNRMKSAHNPTKLRYPKGKNPYSNIPKVVAGSKSNLPRI